MGRASAPARSNGASSCGRLWTGVGDRRGYNSRVSDPLTPDDRQTLLAAARAAIRHGFDFGKPPVVDLAGADAALSEPRGTFVTLKTGPSGGERLRGCIGRLEATRPLLEDVSENAFAAAFRDPRFPPLTRSVWPELRVQIAILSRPEPIPFHDQHELLAQLRPGIDGLILEAEGRRATFLPSVWDQIPDPQTFLQHLKVKAGFEPDAVPADLRVSRYITETIE